MDAIAPTRKQLAARSTGKLMRRLLQEFRLKLDDRLKEHDITSAQVRLLFETRERPGITGAQLARALHVTPQSVQTMMARAVTQGWLVRGTHLENGRLVTLRLTPAGTRLLRLADQAARELESEVWSGVSLTQIRTVAAIFERALQNLNS